MTDKIENINRDGLRQQLEENLPPIIIRRDVKKLTWGIYSPNTLKNADCLGSGPKNAFRIDSRIAYYKNDFIDWVISRSK